MQPLIALIDYGMGNLHSVQKALEHVGARIELVASSADMDRFGGLVLPGVGHFGDGIRQLRGRGLDGLVRQWISSGKPFLGICLGMQMLMEGSEEAPGLDGLGVCKGTVKRFRPEDPSMKVPQMGWNEVDARKDCPLFAAIPAHSRFYFVHSYYVAPTDTSVAAGSTDYGIRYCSFLWHGNMYACQFHPEKSQAEGLRMLTNFTALLPKAGHSV